MTTKDVAHRLEDSPTGQLIEANTVSLAGGALLRDPSALHLKGSVPDIQLPKIRVTIGDRPLCADWSLGVNAQARPEIATFASMFRCRVVTYSIGVVTDGKDDAIRSLGLTVGYPESPGKAVSILDAIPRSEFVRRFGAKFVCGVRGRIRTDFDTAPTHAADGVFEIAPNEIEVGVGLHVEAGGGWNLEYEVKSAQIVATGEGSSAGEWRVYRQAEPLVGTHRFSHVLVWPKNAEQIRAVLRVAVTVGGLLRIPVRVESPEVSLAVPAVPAA